MNNEAYEYARVMAPAFEHALQHVHEPLTDGGEPILGLANCQALVMRELVHIDWAHTNLKPKNLGRDDDEDGSAPLTPHEYANRLANYAFSDAYEVMKLCKDYVIDHDITAHVTMGKLLTNSKKSLLKIARLSEIQKNSLMMGIKYTTEYPTIYKKLITEAGLPNNLEAPIVLNDEPDKPRFTWNEEIDTWINAKQSSSDGCPAHNIIVEANNKKHTLIHLFWDKFVQSMYEI